MSKESFAEQLMLEIVDNPHEYQHEHHQELEVESPEDPSYEVIELVESQPVEEHHHEHGQDGDIEVLEFDSDIPGAPKGTKDPEIEVKEEEVVDESKAEDLNTAKDNKWNLLKNDYEGFFECVHELMKNIPKHSGVEVSGLERAISYLERLDSEISKVMRNDLDSKLDAAKVEKLRATLEEGISNLEKRSDKIKASKKKSKKSKKAETQSDMIVKEAGKALGIQGVFITVPLFISRLGRVCINGSVSAGHDINKIFDDQVKKYKLDDREVAELQQFIEDCGYPMREDRGYSRDEDIEVTDGKYDWASNYTN